MLSNPRSKYARGGRWSDPRLRGSRLAMRLALRWASVMRSVSLAHSPASEYGSPARMKCHGTPPVAERERPMTNAVSASSGLLGPRRSTRTTIHERRSTLRAPCGIQC
eukprot:6135912-Prymnesium_polylepis.1